MTENQPQEPPIKIAFILDGEIADILHTDERLAAIFTSNPLVIDITDKTAEDGTGIMPGATYDESNKSFKNPPYDPPTPEQIANAQKIMEQAKQSGLL